LKAALQASLFLVLRCKIQEECNAHFAAFGRNLHRDVHAFAGIPICPAEPGAGTRHAGGVGVAGLPEGVDEKACRAGIAAWMKLREGLKK
jgi:hypothetical protein